MSVEAARAAVGLLRDLRQWLSLYRQEASRARPRPPSRGLVLEVGPGQAPHPRADVAVEKYIVDNTERSAPFSFAKPLVVADGESLPFESGSFRYVMATHVLEHALDPSRFAGEMARVAAAGFVQVPSSLAEMTFGWPFHHWLSDLRDGVLHMQPRDGRGAWDGAFFHQMFARSPLFRLWFNAYRSKWHHSIEWTGRIPLSVAGAAIPETRATWVAAPTIEALVSAAEALRPLPPEVMGVLRCPADLGRLRIKGDTLECETCLNRYPYVCGRVPLLLHEATL